MDEDKMKELIQRLQEDGVVTAKVQDGRIIMFSVKILEELLAAAKEKNTEHASVFIKDPESLN